MRWIIRLLLNAVALLLVSRFVSGFHISGFATALIAAIVIGLINATVGVFLKIVTFPLTLLTLGIFWWVINALMLILASRLVPGFSIYGFAPAFIGAIVLALLNLIMRWLLAEVEGR
ncbi:MAG: phage holin family protein [Acidobacteriaceae bacterium]